VGIEEQTQGYIHEIDSGGYILEGGKAKHNILLVDDGGEKYVEG